MIIMLSRERGVRVRDLKGGPRPAAATHRQGETGMKVIDLSLAINRLSYLRRHRK